MALRTIISGTVNDWHINIVDALKFYQTSSTGGAKRHPSYLVALVVFIFTDGLLSPGSTSSKCVRIEDYNESIESIDVFGSTVNNYTKSIGINSSCEVIQDDKIENKVKIENRQENVVRGGGKKEKDYIGHSLRSALRSHKSGTNVT
ncbi:2086_t:CDS:2, partial [Dentiscutata heterogama]